MIGGRKHNATGRSISKPADRRYGEWNRPPKGESWTWFTEKMLSSPAMAVLSRAAEKVLRRLVIEHCMHAGTENGGLKTTYSDFEKFGVRPNSIRGALDELEAVGLIETMVRGGRPGIDLKIPSQYRLTWLPSRIPELQPPTDEWAQIETIKEAKRRIAARKLSKRRNG
ncbi:hypothetical protein [Prosthecomicrobium hirschii]|uniref:hypothetical protein n=1 Tax=Prosthecodimorpha hirschii TaxID=665126 RepID=UPI0022210A13|nr:hypothetical protein [Prosthecomicrobium hirschii]MCW1841768.1 hypothetical protein [Prosthecomicrobium hirschii]